MARTIVAFGDSTTAPRGELKVYADHLRDRFPGWTVINAGVGGNTTEMARERFEHDVLAHKPAWVIIQFGINDAAVDVWREPPADRPRVDEGRYADNLRHFVREIRLAGGHPVLMTPNRLCWVEGSRAITLYGKPPYRPDREDGFTRILRQYAERVRRIANEEGVHLVDVYAEYEARAAGPAPGAAAWLLDGQHPNGEGQALVADLLERLLRPLVDAVGDPAVAVKRPLPELPADWIKNRDAIRRLLEEHVFGPLPPVPAERRVVPLIDHTLLVFGKARHRQVKVEWGPSGAVSWVIDILVPDRPGPFPMILSGDGCWDGYHSQTVAEQVLLRGYGLVRFNRCECMPDVRGEGRVPVLSRLFPDSEFGALAAWAWAYHRTLDAVLELPDVDPERIGVFGHSRGGKTSLLAGATDPRIALTGASGSGCGGAGSFTQLGAGAEPVDVIARIQGFWFNRAFASYANREADLPVDLHMLKALVAPRALVTVEGLDDLWANPRGTWATHAAAREVYGKLGAEDRIGVAFLPANHAFGPPAWEAFLDFADWHFRGVRPARDFNACPFSA